METSNLLALSDEFQQIKSTDVAARLITLGIAYVTFRYEDGDPCGEVREITYFNACAEIVDDRVPANIRSYVERMLELGTLLYIQSKFIDCGDQEMRWDLAREVRHPD